MKIDCFKRRLLFLGCVVGVVPLLLGAAQAPRIVEGPERLPHVHDAMLSAEYWIQRLEQPDRLLFTSQQKHEKTIQWQAQGLLHDLRGYGSSIKRYPLRALLKSDFSYLQRVGRYNEKGQRMQTGDYEKIKKNVNTSTVGVSNRLQWGLTVRRTALRLFPTRNIVTSKPNDLEFNSLLHSGLRLAEPVVLLHHSLDKQWYYVDSSVGYGWVEVQDVAWTDQADVVWDYCEKATRVVIDLESEFLDQQGDVMPDTAWMGCHLASDSEMTENVLLPQRNQAGRLTFVSRKVKRAESMLAQHRALSPRSLIEQAFILRGQPYGWGGGSGYGDCSELIRRIGLVCGIEFPRSTQALKRGLPALQLSKSNATRQQQLATSPGGASLLYMPGHIMLVLGTVKHQLFVIHNLYGIHAQDQQGAYIQRVARVVVSDLSLGKTGTKGTLWQRVSDRLEITPGLDKQPEIE